MERKTDEQILEEYLALMEHSVTEFWRGFMLKLVRNCREDEPRINCGAHLVDYLAICDADDTMDTFYGPNYFDE